MKNYKKINYIIFGYADIGKRLYEYLQSEGVPNILFCDNSTQKQKENPELVLSLKNVVNMMTADTRFYVASIYHDKQMKEQLLSLGVPGNQIMSELPKEIVDFIHEKEYNQRLTPLKRLRFETAIVRHCNLKCKGCDHFSPVAEKRFVSINSYEKDVKRLADLFNGDAEYITLLGGEPLLHPDITDFIIISRQYFPETLLQIATNGLLLKNMSEAFWEACRKYKVEIMVTKYPINLDYLELGKFVEAKKTKYKYLGSSEGGRTLWHFPLDLDGKQKPMDSFTRCRNANLCHTLDNGRLYTCSIAPNIDDFNKYFDKNIQLMDADGVDIHAEGMSGEYILKRLAAPMPFCRYCDVDHRTYDHDWEQSTMNIKEWTL